MLKRTISSPGTVVQPVTRKYPTHVRMKTTSSNIYSDYTKSLGDHNFKIMAGFNAELYRPSGLNGFGTDLISPDVPSLGLTQDNKKASSWLVNAPLPVSSDVSTTIMPTVMAEANLRYDGSSRFIGDQRWGFPFLLGWLEYCSRSIFRTSEQCCRYLEGKSILGTAW